MSNPYAVLADLYTHGLALAMMGSVTTGQQQAVLDAVAAEADSKMRARYPVPLTAPIDPVLTQKICHIAAFEVLAIRGFNPQSGADRMIVERADKARKFLDDVERQSAHLNVAIPVSRSPVDLAAPNVVTSPNRGW